ncbi:MAG: hypothetical protein V3V05_06890 [Pontiella sp.]
MKLLKPDQWNRERAAHLLVRAGFGATPAQIKRAANRPMEEVVDELLKPGAEVAPPSCITPESKNKINFRTLKNTLSADERNQESIPAGSS